MDATNAYIYVKAAQMSAHGWVAVTYVLFLESHGLTAFERNQVNGFFMLCVLSLDIFTGALGDRFGHKKIYLTGLFLWVLAMFTYGFSSSVKGFLIAEGVAAVGFALCSEALESWYRNTVGVNNAHLGLSKAERWGHLLSIPLALVGALVGDAYGYKYSWFLAGTTFALGGLLAVFLLKNYPEVHGDSEIVVLSVWSSIKEVFVLVKNNNNLRWISYIVVLVAACFQPFNMSWPTILKDLSVPARWSGALWFLVAVGSTIGAMIVEKNSIPSKRLIVLFAALVGVVMLPTGLFPNLWVIVLCFSFHEIARGGLGLLVGTYSNMHIPNRLRSTGSSYMSTIVKVGSLLGLLFFGYLTEFFTEVQVWSISAGVLIILGLWSLKK